MEDNKIKISEFFSTNKNYAIRCSEEREVFELLVAFTKMEKTWNSGESYMHDAKFIDAPFSYYTNHGTVFYGSREIDGLHQCFDFDQVVFDIECPLHIYKARQEIEIYENTLKILEIIDINIYQRFCIKGQPKNEFYFFDDKLNCYSKNGTIENDILQKILSKEIEIIKL